MAAKLIDTRADGPQRVDRYELIAEIASGGMATVYLARLCGVGGFQRFLAIKRLHPHLASEEEFVQMFLDEARLAAGIHHPNVVPILEVGASERGYYLVMEYVEGDTLARLLARAASEAHAVPGPVGLRIVVDMLCGLHAAHELRDERGELAGLVHRDVSPQNILVGTDGNSRITDFGVARAASRMSGTRAGQLKGKIAYMAPEQAAGGAVDRRADVFAAGIILWEVLASRRLFRADNEAATLGRVLNAPIKSPREYAPEVPAGLASVCMRALERDPERRFATAAELADAIERAAPADSPVLRVGAPREVAAYTAQLIGQEIRDQWTAVRAWAAQSEPSQSAPSSHRTVGPGTVSSATLSISVPSSALAPAPAHDATLPQPAARRARRRKWLVWGPVAVLGFLAGYSVLIRGKGGADVSAVQGDAEAATLGPPKNQEPDRGALSSRPAREDPPGEAAGWGGSASGRAHAPGAASAAIHPDRRMRSLRADGAQGDGRERPPLASARAVQGATGPRVTVQAGNLPPATVRPTTAGAEEPAHPAAAERRGAASVSDLPENPYR